MTERNEPRTSRRWLPGAAIAVVVAIWVTTRDRPKPPIERDPGALTCVAPAGEVAAVERFEWTFELPEGGSFELRLYDESYQLLGQVPDLTETFYELDPAVAEQLPPTFTWEIFARDATGADLGTCRSEVTRT